MKDSFKRWAFVTTSSVAMISIFATAAIAQTCEETVRVLAQPRDGLTLLENYQDEFLALSGANFQIDYLNEGDRRTKSRADASTTGRYNVYYVDEANVAQFAQAGWLAPLLDHYPEEYDFDDFDDGRKTIATVDGTVWFAPINGGGDLLVYRKDLFEAAGIEVPTTLEEMEAAIAALHDPDNGIYGIALRGQRGSGANVWRWSTYFAGYGGEWFVDSVPAFNSEAGIAATEEYLKLFEFSPPGTRTGSWDEATGSFNAGQVAMIVESAALGGLVIDPAQSQVSDVVGFAPPPAPLAGGGYSHGLAIGARGNDDQAALDCAGLWVAWATSLENEQRRLEAGLPGELNRKIVIGSDSFTEQFGADLAQGLVDSGAATKVTFWRDARWPELGNRWGIILEELITGQRDDIPEALAELEDFAKDLVSE